MADINDFFSNLLPVKLKNDPSLAQDINASYQFDVDGAGTWSVDLTDGHGVITEGPMDSPSCTVSAKSKDFANLLDNPGQATMLFMMGKLKVDNVALAMALQKILG